MRTAARTVGGLALAGAAVTAWSIAETRRFMVDGFRVPVLPPGSKPLRVLHLSDLHTTPRQGMKLRWLSGLDDLVEPDLTVVTGDFLADVDAVPVVLDALGGLLRRPGVFVLGSNDYYAPRIVNPFGYLLKPTEISRTLPSLPWGDLVAGLREAGWADLDNREAVLHLGRSRLAVAFRGVDDPHIGLDRYGEVAGPFPGDAALRIGVAHAPYLRILDEMVADGADIVLAGHTHGGQVCLPGGRAIVTNCDLDTARASGLSRHVVGQKSASTVDDGAWLHVSAGLGTAPSAPFRLFCRPRATVLEWVPVA